MAINKKLIHFKTFNNFNSKKLSANVENTKYTLGIDGEIQTGSPDILYQSIVYIKDTQQQWTHGQLYNIDIPTFAYYDRYNKIITYHNNKDEIIKNLNIQLFDNGYSEIDILNNEFNVSLSSNYEEHSLINSQNYKKNSNSVEANLTNKKLQLGLVHNYLDHNYHNTGTILEFYDENDQPRQTRLSFREYNGIEFKGSSIRLDKDSIQIGSFGVTDIIENGTSTPVVRYGLNDINLEGVADPTKNNHAANKNYVDSRTYQTNRELSLLYNFIDLGLPSGTLWSSCNVGANSPEESGNYYAWGELSSKPEYTNNNYKYPKILDNISGNAQYDAARVNWGGEWRIPTKDEMQELLNNCSKTFTTQNGVKGYKLISKNNSNVIFLPACGYYYGSVLNGAPNYGYYWTSTYRANSYSGYCLRFYNNNSYIDYFNSYYGYSIRPVLNNSINNNNHEYIDMGLPSGLLWATCNVGAATPEAFGNYYAWGETRTKSEYTSSNNNAYNNPIFNIASSPFDIATYTNRNWSIPTYVEFEELKNNCEIKYTNLNGIKGFEFISKINGKMIFMPKVGYYDEYGINDYYFRYWSSTNYNQTSSYYLEGYNYSDDSYGCNIYNANSYYGMPIRPVTKIKTESQINIPKIQYIPNESSMPETPVEGVLYLIGEE